MNQRTQIGMTVFRRTGRPYFECQWTDPNTGLKKTKSTKRENRPDALVVAAKLELDILEFRYHEKHCFTWREFCDRYKSDYVPMLRPKTAAKVQTVINSVTRILSPKLLSSIDAAAISKYQRTMRQEGLAESTIKGNLTYLQGMLNWAKRQGLLERVPHIDMPRRTAAMRGRPITEDEFERMLEAVPGAMFGGTGSNPEFSDEFLASWNARRDLVVESWRHLLRGLWWSGLRLGEALSLQWDANPSMSVTTIDGELMLSVGREGQKNGISQIAPIATEFKDFLLSTPETDRHGFVFNPMSTGGYVRVGDIDTASRRIVNIGKAANVKVAETPNRRKRKDSDAGTKVKYASAHDLRRSFGERWATRVTPYVLMLLMRHQFINTTITFYVGRNAITAARSIAEWENRQSGKPKEQP